MTKYIYLDQNHWINLAKAFLGKNDAYKEVVEKVIEKSESGEWIFPLSIIHIMETESRFDDRSRIELSKFMSKISRNYSIVPSIYTDKFELRNSIAAAHGMPIVNMREEVIKKDFLRVVGLDGANFKINGNIKPEEKEKLQQFLVKKLETEPILEKLMSIPQDKKRIEQTIQDMTTPIEEYEKLRSELMKVPKEHREKVFIADSFINSHGEELMRIFEESGKTKETFLPDKIFDSPESIMKFLESTPSLNVRTKLVFSILTEIGRGFDRNDYKDICFLSTAVPYCDIVLTERLWVHYLSQWGLDEEYNVKLSKDLNFLLEED
ncbi:hypothetical protein BAQ47_03200 [Bacillus tropicus]|uniref:hypothetical protein n=1 Tax=Bacillus tropicus TaxID=2026188 RepID=UPI0008FE8241|nr:hypothetical protein [Bacillus tropicus]OJE31669.1 hypothetical protein BAQ47_03200 [Bacillus tropicus]